jgi:hypothetical protein
MFLIKMFYRSGLEDEFRCNRGKENVKKLRKLYLFITFLLHVGRCFAYVTGLSNLCEKS